MSDVVKRGAGTRVRSLFGGLPVLLVAALLMPLSVAKAQTPTDPRNQCGALASGAATCSNQAYAGGIRYDVATGWLDGVAGDIALTVTGGQATTITSPTATGWGSGIVVRTAQQTDTTSRTIALTVGTGSNAVAIAQSTNTINDGFDNTGVAVHQRGARADATTVTLGSGVTIGTMTTPMKQYGVHMLAENGANTGTQTITSAATIHSTGFGLVMDNRGAGNSVVTNSGSITTTETGGTAGQKSGIRILDWSHNPGGSPPSIGGDSRTTSTTTTVTNSGSVTVSASNAHGVHVTADGLGLYKTVNSGTVSASGAGGRGILVEARFHTGLAGTKAVEIENSGAITAAGEGAIGLYVETVDNAALNGRGRGSIAITNSGSISSKIDAIRVNSNMGDVSVTHSGGSITSEDSSGITVHKSQRGDVTINSGADISAGREGIWVRKSRGAGDISIKHSDGKIMGYTGIRVDQIRDAYTTGDISIDNSGPIEVSSGFGILAVGNSGVTITNAGNISRTPRTDGTDNIGGSITVSQNGAGDVSVVNSGDVDAYLTGIDVTKGGAGTVSVTHSKGKVAAATGISIGNWTGAVGDVTVAVTGGSVTGHGQNGEAVEIGQHGTGDVAASLSSGATLTSKHGAGIRANLNHPDNALGQMDVTQAGSIEARTGVYARVPRVSAMGETTRRRTRQPVIDIAWSGRFSHGTTATVAQNDDDRFRTDTAAAAINLAQQVEAEKAMRPNGGSDGLLRYGSPAGIEAHVMSWRDVTAAVAKGDDPGAFADAAAVTALFDSDADAATQARAAAILAQFKAALGNGEVDVGSRVFDDIKTGATSLDGVTDEEITTYLSENEARRRTLLQNVLAQSLSDEEKAVLRAVATNAALDAALDDEDADFSDDYKMAVRALLESYNLGNIKVAMTGGSIVASRGDGIRAYYATPNDMNGEINVTIASDTAVTGNMAGIYVANAGTVSVAKDSVRGKSLGLTKDVTLRKQFVTVNGMVTGGTDAAVHLVGGGTLTVGEMGKLIAGSSGRAILVNEPGRSVIVINGEVRGGLADGTAAVETDGGGSITLGQTGRVVLPEGAPNAIRANGADTAVTLMVADLYLDSAEDARDRLGGAVVGDSTVSVAVVDEDGPTGMGTPVSRDDDGRLVIDKDKFDERPEKPGKPGKGGTMACEMASDHRCRLYEALPSVLLTMNGLPSLDERMSAARDGNGGWVRVDGAAGEWEAKSSTQPNMAFDYRRYDVQAGVDMAMGKTGRFGASVRGLQGSAEMAASGGEAELSGVGAGVHGTVLSGGFHLDVQAMATWYDVKLTSAQNRVLKSGANGLGYALAVEVGRRTAVGKGVFVTPGVGLAWSAASLDFTDERDTPVSMEKARSLTGRAGLRVEAEPSEGLRLFGSVKATHEFSEERRAKVPGVTLKATEESTGVRVGLGGERGWENGRYALRGAAGYEARGGDNREFDGGLSFAVRF